MSLSSYEETYKERKTSVQRDSSSCSSGCTPSIVKSRIISSEEIENNTDSGPTGYKSRNSGKHSLNKDQKNTDLQERYSPNGYSQNGYSQNKYSQNRYLQNGYSEKLYSEKGNSQNENSQNGGYQKNDSSKHNSIKYNSFKEDVETYNSLQRNIRQHVKTGTNYKASQSIGNFFGYKDNQLVAPVPCSYRIMSNGMVEGNCFEVGTPNSAGDAFTPKMERPRSLVFASK